MTAGPTKRPMIRSTRDRRNFYKVEKWGELGLLGLPSLSHDVQLISTILKKLLKRTR
jgi:hypothetical protein